MTTNSVVGTWDDIKHTVTPPFSERTLRDWFAGQVLPQAYAGCVGASPDDGETWAGMVAREAYDLADAMLEARK